MARQRPDHLTAWRSVSYEYITHDTQKGQIWVFADALRALDIDDPDGRPVYIVIEMPPGRPVYSGKKIMKSGPEIYGTDIADVVEPNSRVRVMLSVPAEETEAERPPGNGGRFVWGKGDIVITRRPDE